MRASHSSAASWSPACLGRADEPLVSGRRPAVPQPAHDDGHADRDVGQVPAGRLRVVVLGDDADDLDDAERHRGGRGRRLGDDFAVNDLRRDLAGAQRHYLGAAVFLSPGRFALGAIG